MTVDKSKVACPTCGMLDTWKTDNPSKPFCSPRCKLIDLGEWAEGRAIPGDPTDPGASPMDDDSVDNPSGHD